MGDRVRVTAQLIEAVSGEHVWAQRHGHELHDAFSPQDELSTTIVATIGGRVTSERWRRERQTGITFEAYDLVLRAQALHFLITKSQNREARYLTEKSLALESGNARVHMPLSAIHLMDYWALWTSDPRGSLRRAVEHGKRSV